MTINSEYDEIVDFRERDWQLISEKQQKAYFKETRLTVSENRPSSK